MNQALHQDLVGFIWNIANKLRGPYRPPQYRRVMLPLLVLRCLDTILEAKGFKNAALDKALSKVAVGQGQDHHLPLYNVSPFTFQKLLGAPLKKAVIAALSERDPSADICCDKKGNPEPDTEIVPLPDDIELPLPLGYDNETHHNQFLPLARISHTRS